MLQVGAREQLLGVHFDAVSGEQRLSDGQGQLWLSTRYDKGGILAGEWTLDEGAETRCSQKHDR